MSTGFIQRVPITPLSKEYSTIHAHLLSHTSDVPLLVVDLAGMPKEAVDQTKRFVKGLQDTSNGRLQLKVLVEEDVSKETVFSVTLESLPEDACERIWLFFERLEDRF